MTQEAIAPLTAIRDGLINLKEWDKESIHQVITAVSEKLELKLGKIAQPVRVAVSGSTVSPPIDITLVLLGRERTIERLDAALNLCEKARVNQ